MQERYGLVSHTNSPRTTMYSLVRVSLELNIRQLILSDLAASVGEVKTDTPDSSVLSAVDLITSRVETRDVSGEHNSADAAEEDAEERVFMVRP